MSSAYPLRTRRAVYPSNTFCFLMSEYREPFRTTYRSYENIIAHAKRWKGVIPAGFKRESTAWRCWMEACRWERFEHNGVPA